MEIGLSEAMGARHPNITDNVGKALWDQSGVEKLVIKVLY